MEFPSWFQSAIQRRLDHVSAWVENRPDLLSYRVEENKALDAMLSGVDKTQTPEFMEWEDKHHLKRALEHEGLYLQGMRDGVQLVIALLADPVASEVEALGRAGSGGGTHSDQADDWSSRWE